MAVVVCGQCLIEYLLGILLPLPSFKFQGFSVLWYSMRRALLGHFLLCFFCFNVCLFFCSHMVQKAVESSAATLQVSNSDSSNILSEHICCPKLCERTNSISFPAIFACRSCRPCSALIHWEVDCLWRFSFWGICFVYSAH